MLIFGKHNLRIRAVHSSSGSAASALGQPQLMQQGLWASPVTQLMEQDCIRVPNINDPRRQLTQMNDHLVGLPKYIAGEPKPEFATSAVRNALNETRDDPVAPPPNP